MCGPGIIPLAGAAAGAGTTAAGAGALATGLKFAGLALSVVGPIIQGQQTARAARVNAEYTRQQSETVAQLTATKADREQEQYRQLIARQRGELIARGVQLDSPTAVFLGETAAREMAFNAQAIRSDGQAQRQELSAEEAAWRARGKRALFQGGLSAAGALLNQEPDDWVELLS